MQSFLPFVAANVAFLSVVNGIETKYVSVESVNRETLLYYSSDIFTPQSSVVNSHAAHSVHVFDDRGRFMKLDFEAEHTKHSEFWKIDHSPHNDSIVDINCKDRSLTNPSMIITFTNESTADDYYEYIKSIVNDKSVKNHYLVGSHLWLCENYQTKRYSPILRRIKNVVKDGNNNDKLRLNTEYVQSYGEIFENLNVRFETNMKVHDESFNRPSLGGSRRRLQSWLGDLWDDITTGITTFFSNVASWVEDLAESAVGALSDIVNALIGKTVAKSYSYTQSWSDNITGTYLDSSDAVLCSNCYAGLDLTYTYQMRISSWSLDYFLIEGSGEADMAIEIDTSESWSAEYVKTSDKIEVPYLSFEIFGVTFAFDIYGKIGFGADIDADFCLVGVQITGNVSYGLEYVNTSGANYISDHSFVYGIAGPELEYSTADLEVYVRPTVYLELDYVGSVYFGLQGEAEFTITENSGSSDCVIDYTPTAKITTFVGGRLAPLNYTLWNGSTQLSTYQATLTSLEGCITQSELTTYELSWSGSDSTETTATYSYTETDTDTTATDGSDTSGTAGTTGTERRRLAGNKNRQYTNFHVNYNSPNTLAYTQPMQLWGKKGNEWWGNLTNAICESPYENSNETLADEGWLLLRVTQAKRGEFRPLKMIGIYQTKFNNYTLIDGSKINFLCLARLNFTEQNSTVYKDLPNFSFHVSLLEYYCDVSNESLLYINDGDSSADSATSITKTAFLKMITLDTSMEAISGGSHYRTIYLYDRDSYCHSFILSKQFAYDLVSLGDRIDANLSKIVDTSELENDVKSQLALHSALSGNNGWFGTYHCSSTSSGIDIIHYTTMIFQEFDYGTNNVTVFARIDTDSDADGAIESSGETWLNGEIDWSKNMLCLNGFGFGNDTSSSSSDDDTVQFCGFLTMLEDGSLYYTGNVSYVTKNCNGFALKGYVNANSLIKENSNANSGNSGGSVGSNTSGSDDLDSESFAYGILAGIGICLIVLVLGGVILMKCMGFELVNKRKNGNYAMMNEL